MKPSPYLEARRSTVGLAEVVFPDIIRELLRERDPAKQRDGSRCTSTLNSLPQLTKPHISEKSLHPVE